MGIEVFIPAAEFAAQAAEATALGAEVASALAAVELAVAAAPIIVVGAGIGGAILAKQLWDSYGFGGFPPALQPPVSGGQSGAQYRVKIRYQLVNGEVQEDFYPFPLTGKIYGIGKGDAQGRARYYISHNINEQTDVLTAIDSLIQIAPTIVEIQPATGTDNPGTMPRNFQEKPPQDFPIRVPYPFVLPGESTPTIFTPEVFPSPVIDPDPDTKKAPGVLVRIPETGSQIQITPEGAFKTRYSPPLTAPGVAPQSTPTKAPPKVAVDPCPCPENKPDLDEVLCRLKRLESDLLDNGYDRNTVAGASGQGGVVDWGEAYVSKVSLQITGIAYGERTQRSAPGTPTVYFIGWFSWVKNNFPGERVNIGYLNTNWVPPEGVTGYLYSLHDGCTATSSYEVLTKKDYVDNC